MFRTNKLILICVETTNKAQTDSAYIDKAIKFIYKINNEIKLDYLYLGSKTKYNDNGIQKRIKSKIKDFSQYEIVYCLDTDDVFAKPENIDLNKSIDNFCAEKNYKLIWFCQDIEEVFLHHQVDNTHKIAEAKKFGSVPGLGKATKSKLSMPSDTSLLKQSSNFMTVLDTIFDKS